MIHVFLDDLRPCPKGFVLARTAAECLLLLENDDVGLLSLDHDLGWNQMNGFELTKEMVRRGLFAREIYLHTSSSIGRMNMFQHLYRYKPEHVKVHSYPMPDDVLNRVAKEAG